MHYVTQDDLNKILEKHMLWLEGNLKGMKADLRGADLHRADLYEANLHGADLRGADLCEADLDEAKL